VIRCKPGVRLFGLRPEFAPIFVVLSLLFESRGREVVITSAAESKTRHRLSSLHYAGCAIDVRSKALDSPESKLFVLDALRGAGFAEFDFLLEDLGGVNEHFHIEFQPKRI